MFDFHIKLTIIEDIENIIEECFEEENEELRHIVAHTSSLNFVVYYSLDEETVEESYRIKLFYNMEEYDLSDEFYEKEILMWHDQEIRDEAFVTVNYKKEYYDNF